MAMKCDCGRVLTNAPTHQGHSTDDQMGVYTRVKRCQCAKQYKTVEIRADELSELRRRAYLWGRHHDQLFAKETK